MKSITLQVIKAGDTVDHVQVPQGETGLLFGRDGDVCDVVCSHESISREHAKVYLVDGKVWVCAMLSLCSYRLLRQTCHMVHACPFDMLDYHRYKI